MKLLLDQNLSRRMLPALEPHFPGSTQVGLIGLDHADDRAIWAFARDNGFALVTKDADFHELSVLYGFPPKVIWLKCGNSATSTVTGLLLDRSREIVDFLLDAEASCLEVYDSVPPAMG